MNSYNENLNSVVLTSLQNQSLAEKSIYSKLNATMFKLYYAEGATISAGEQMKIAKQDTIVKEAVKNATVNNTNMSNNQLASAKQANQYYKQSINNMAVCAANVQVAANAIVKLAGDVGSIFSIVNAADRYSDIFQDTVVVRGLIDNTAHAAEEASKLAMDTSMYTSEVSVPTVLDKSTHTNSTINTLLTINSKAFDDALALVNSDNSTLATVSANEKLAEGEFEDIAIDFRATKQAYNSCNKELNLDLWVSKESDTFYKITFNQLDNPFHESDVVNDYHLIIVKKSKAAIFNISNAEVIRQNSLGLPNGKVSNQFINVPIPDKGPLELEINFLNYQAISGSTSTAVLDSDGDPMKLGVNYVVFVMAVYSDRYKRVINNFTDFLSAPSREFVLTNTLNRVDGKDIKVDRLLQNRSEEDIKIELEYRLSQNLDIKFDFEFHDEGLADYTYKVHFDINEGEPYHPVYHCMFLPASSDLNDSLLTRSALRTTMEKSLDIVHFAESKAKSAILLVKKYEHKLHQLEEDERETNKEIADLTAKLAAEPNDENVKQWSDQLAKQKKELAKLKEQEIATQKLLKIAREEAVSKEAEKAVALPFLFNLPLAEQVSASNYITMKTKPHKKTEQVQDNLKDKPKKQHWYAYFGPEATDNFGNFLIDGEDYFPVILTVSKNGIDDPNNYTNALSVVSLHSKFTYNQKSNPKK